MIYYLFSETTNEFNELSKKRTAIAGNVMFD